jgi:hypothetical protein
VTPDIVSDHTLIVIFFVSSIIIIAKCSFINIHFIERNFMNYFFVASELLASIVPVVFPLQFGHLISQEFFFFCFLRWGETESTWYVVQ